MDVQLLLVLLLGVGLGSAAAAWATRRPETVVRVGPRTVQFEGDPTPEQVEEFRRAWQSMDPYMDPVNLPHGQ